MLLRNEKYRGRQSFYAVKWYKCPASLIADLMTMGLGFRRELLVRLLQQFIPRLNLIEIKL